MNRPVTVLIVDDHEIVRQGVRGYLAAQDEFEVVAETGSGEEAVALAQEHVPDVVLMDLIMPGIDGVEATRKVKSVSPRSQIVVLTSYHDNEHIFPALKAGASSYVLKDVGLEDLAETILKTARGEATLDPRVASRVIKELQGPRGEDVNPYTELTNREMDVLRLIAAGKSNSEIAEELVVSEHTVKGHVSNILSKLHLGDRTQAAVYAWQKGVVRRD